MLRFTKPLSRFSKKSIVIAASAVAAASVLTSGSTADAARKVDANDIRKNAIRAKHIKNNVVGSNHLRNNSIRPADLTPALRRQVNKAGPRGQRGAQGPAGPAGAPGKDGVGLAYSEAFETTPIANIGGSFATRATKVGSFELEAGSYVVWMNAIFTDAVNPATTATPQLQAALRANDDPANSVWGDDLGTIFSANFPTDGLGNNEQEITSASMKVVTLTEAATVNVYAFGYNDDGSSQGGNSFDATIDVAVTPVG